MGPWYIKSLASYPVISVPVPVIISVILPATFLDGLKVFEKASHIYPVNEL